MHMQEGRGGGGRPKSDEGGDKPAHCKADDEKHNGSQAFLGPPLTPEAGRQ